MNAPPHPSATAQGDLQHFALLEASVARLNDIVLITEAEPLDEPGPRIVFVNDAFERLTGHRREEVLGKSPRFLHGPLTDRHELDRIRAALEARLPVHSELVNYTRAGEPFWLDLDIVPVVDAAGRHTHFVAVQRDITERKRVLQALYENEQRFQAVARANSDTIWDWDLISDRIWWNEGMQSTFGHEPADLPADSSSWTRYLHPDDHDRVLKSIQQVIDSGGTNWAAEYRFLRRSGEYAYVLDRGSVIRDDNGRALRMVGGITDLSSRNEAAIELARLNRALRMRSACNEIVIHATDEKGLLDEICRIAVEVGGYRMAWIGYTRDDAEQSVAPVAWAGQGTRYLQDIPLSWSDDKAVGRGPVGRAIRSNQVVMIEDLESDPVSNPGAKPPCTTVIAAWWYCPCTTASMPTGHLRCFRQAPATSAPKKSACCRN